MKKMLCSLLLSFGSLALVACGGGVDIASATSSGGGGEGGAISTTTSTSSSSTTTTATSSSSGSGGSGGMDQEATLELSPGMMPPSQIIVQTQKYRVFSAYTYKVGTSGTKPIVASACVSQDDPNGDMADVDAFMLANLQAGDSVPISSATVTGNTACFTFATDQVAFTQGSTGVLDLAAHVMVPISSAAAGGAWHGVPRSGHTPRFRLVSVTTKGGQKIVLPQHTTPLMVLRKSEPIVTQQALPSTALVNGVSLPIAAMQIAADVAGPISQKALKFHLTKTAGFTVQDFKLYRGATEIDPATYSPMLDCTPFGCGNVFSSSATQMGLDVVFTDEEVIQGSGNLYTLRATLSGVTNGAFLTVTLPAYDNDKQVVTGQIYMTYPTYLTITGSVPTAAAQYWVWSDGSETSHSAALDTSPIPMPKSSADWTNGYLVQNLSFTQTLTF